MGEHIHIYAVPPRRGSLIKKWGVRVAIALAIYQFVPGVKPIVNTGIASIRANICMMRQDAGWKVWKNAKCFKPGWMANTDDMKSIEGINAPNERIEQAVDYYLSEGLTINGTAYLVGSLAWESGLDPNAVGDDGLAEGINQWHPLRRRDMPETFEAQLAWALEEMERDSPGTLNTLKTSNDEATIKAAIKRWTRWGIRGKRWEYAKIIKQQMLTASVPELPSYQQIGQRALMLIESPALALEMLIGNDKGKEIAAIALTWKGQDFNPGRFAQCAYFVRHVLNEAGLEVGVSQSPMDGVMAPMTRGMANSLSGPDIGKIIKDKEALLPGDIVFFSGTYTPSWMTRSQASRVITHVGIYVSDGMMVDRSTASRPVQHRPISTFTFYGAVRPYSNSLNQAE